MAYGNGKLDGALFVMLGEEVARGRMTKSHVVRIYVFCYWQAHWAWPKILNVPPALRALCGLSVSKSLAGRVRRDVMADVLGHVAEIRPG